jgi:hypothetical protein
LKVRILNPQYLTRDRYCFLVPQYIDYEGEETSVRGQPLDTLALTTGEADFPVRVIPRAWIVSEKSAGDAGAAAGAVQGSSDTQTYTVAGSKGAVYTVTQQGSRWTCTCQGFEFRRHCRHITELAKTH